MLETLICGLVMVVVLGVLHWRSRRPMTVIVKMRGRQHIQRNVRPAREVVIVVPSVLQPTDLPQKFRGQHADLVIMDDVESPAGIPILPKRVIDKGTEIGDDVESPQEYDLSDLPEYMQQNYKDMKGDEAKARDEVFRRANKPKLKPVPDDVMKQLREELRDEGKIE